MKIVKRNDKWYAEVYLNIIGKATKDRFPAKVSYVPGGKGFVDVKRVLIPVPPEFTPERGYTDLDIIAEVEELN